MGNCKMLKKYAKACTGILIAPSKRPRSLDLLRHKDDSARMAQLNFYDSLSRSVRNAFNHRISCGTQSNGDSRPRPLPSQSVVIRLYNNVQDHGDCQNTRKSHKTALTVGWVVGRKMWVKKRLAPTLVKMN